MGDEPRSYEEVVALATKLHRTKASVIAMDDSTDPYYVTPGRVAKAEWFTDLWQTLAFPSKVHVRAIHYRLISQATPVLMHDGKPYENTTNCQGILKQAVRDARYLELIPAGTIIDNKNPRPSINFWPADDIEARVAVFLGGIQRHEFGSGYKAPIVRLPSLGLNERPKVHQRYHLEIWVEKSTMNDVILPIGRLYAANVATFEGESSLTACEDLVSRAIVSGKPVRIFYISDFDPSGEDMPVSAARKIDFVAKQSGETLDIRLMQVALTRQQCIDYRLPRTPIKASDKRGADFEARHGDGGTELDALEALHPGALREILATAIEPYYDRDLHTELGNAISELEADLRAVETEVREEYSGDITALNEEYEAINLAFDQRHSPARTMYDEACTQALIIYHDVLNGMRDEFTKMEQDFIQKANPVIEAINVAIEEQAPDPDDVEWPEPAEVEEDDGDLYDSMRGYIEQVDRFRAHQGNDQDATIGRLYDLTCDVCGKAFAHFRTSTRFCSPRCRRDGWVSANPGYWRKRKGGEP